MSFFNAMNVLQTPLAEVRISSRLRSDERYLIDAAHQLKSDAALMMNI